MNQLTSDIVEQKKRAEKEIEEKKRAKSEEIKKRIVPTLALVVANLIFLSLDARAVDVVYKMTASPFLSAATVIVSGVLALFWWDVLFPHSRKHSNQTQTYIAYAGAGFGIVLSLVLAFFDYVVGDIRVNPVFMWGMVVAMTAVQGVLLLWWWQIDNSIEAASRRQKAAAGRADLQELVDDFGHEIKSMKDIAAQLAELEKNFPGRGQAAKAARAMGYTVLASMLDDDDRDGVPNYRDKDWKAQKPPLPAPQLQNAAVYPSETPNVAQKPATGQENPIKGGGGRP